MRTPVANSFVECYIGKTKWECLNHFFCISLDQLDYINRQWLAYYNNERPHQGVDIGNKVLRPGFMRSVAFRLFIVIFYHVPRSP